MSSFFMIFFMMVIGTMLLVGLLSLLRDLMTRDPIAAPEFRDGVSDASNIGENARYSSQFVWRSSEQDRSLE